MLVRSTMAKNRIVNTRFWVDDYIGNLDPVEKLLFLYFLTNPATDISGVYEIPLKTVATDTGIEHQTVARILKRFSRDRKIFYQNGWVGIVNFAKHQLDNPSVQAGIKNGLNKAPKFILDKLGTVGGQSVPSQSHTNTNTNTNTDTDPNTDSDVPAPTKKFQPPTIQEITNYCSERKNTVDPERFMAHYESNGWKVGRNPMKDWRAAVRYWEKSGTSKKGTEIINFDQ